MITAIEARKQAEAVTNTKVSIAMSKIEQAILTAAKQSKKSVLVYIDLTADQRTIVQDEVKRLGYQIKYDAGYYDQRDSSSSESFTISW